MSLINIVSAELLGTLARGITGQLYTEKQIKTITTGTIGKYFAEFFPTPKDEIAAIERAETARKHIYAASTIIRDMQEDLETQNCKLGELLEEVEQKKQLADRYQILAHTSQKAFEAFRAEMEEALRNELQEQTEKGKRIRQVVSIILWIITLVAGAALGTYFENIFTWITGGA
jgi:hypothetical protein